MLTIADPSAVPAARSFVHWVCDPVAASVPQVRSRVRAVLDDWRVPVDVVDVLLVVVSELVGNVVRHAGVAGRMRVAVVEGAAGSGWRSPTGAPRCRDCPRPVRRSTRSPRAGAGY